jgi:hypothetical protein
MDVLSDEEVRTVVGRSKLAAKYNEAVDSESAHEILTRKLEAAEQRTEEIEQMEQQAKEEKREARRSTAPKEESWMDNPVVRQAGRTAASILTRSLLGVLGVGSTRKRRSSGWF